MRIAYLLADPGIGVFGTKGASVHVQEMVRAFRALGHEVTVFATKRGSRSDDASTEFVPADLRDLPVFVVPVSGTAGAAEREKATARAARRLAVLAAEGDYDLIYERYSLFSTGGAHLKAHPRSETRPLFVAEVNSPLLAEQSAHRRLHHTESAMQATMQTFTAADVISCVSEPVADWVRNFPGGADMRQRVVVTPNAVNPERFAPPQGRAQTRNPQFTIGFLGTLKPWHGTETLVQALAAAPATVRSPWRCEVVGDGPQRPHLESLADSLGVREQLVFRGAMPPEEVPGALAGWDVGVAPYPAPREASEHYFSPLKVYEYLAAGLPVVASAVGEIPEVIEHGRTGVLVPGSDPAALAAALSQLDGDPAGRAGMGAQARSTAEELHSWVSRAAELLRRAEVLSTTADSSAGTRVGVSG